MEAKKIKKSTLLPIINDIKKLGVRKRTKRVGSLGALLVMLLLLENGLDSQPMDPCMDFDILTENGIRIEVKTSVLHIAHCTKNGVKYTQRYWNFANHSVRRECKDGYVKQFLDRRNRNCDFFIFVCLDEDLDFRKAKVFVVPKEVIGDRQHISIPEHFKVRASFSLKSYDGRWDLIKNFNSNTNNKKIVIKRLEKKLDEF